MEVDLEPIPVPDGPADMDILQQREQGRQSPPMHSPSAALHQQSQQRQPQRQSQQQPTPPLPNHLQEGDISAFQLWELSPAADAVGYQAQQLSEERLERSLSPQELVQLKLAYFTHHQPVEGETPGDMQLIAWLAEHLQVPSGGYDEDSSEELAESPIAALAAADASDGNDEAVNTSVASSQQQPQRQQLFSPNAVAVPMSGGLRRSCRAGAGAHSRGFSQVFGRGFLLSPLPSAAAHPRLAAVPVKPGRRKGRPGC